MSLRIVHNRDPLPVGCLAAWAVIRSNYGDETPDVLRYLEGVGGGESPFTIQRLRLARDYQTALNAGQSMAREIPQDVWIWHCNVNSTTREIHYFTP